MKWTRGIVRKKTVWTEGLFTLEVEAPDVECFEPGQFLQLGIEQEPKHLHRPYSVASPHGNVLDFFIVLVEDGRLTPKLWQMEAGDEIDVSKRAAGSFTLSHCPQEFHSIWLLGTGTGLAPYIAMMRQPDIWNQYENVVVVHGVRHRRDLAYQSELANLASQHGKHFAYVPVVSREDVEGAVHGRITNAIASGQLEALAQHQLDPSCCVMMCGNPAMLDETETLLAERGMQRHKRNAPGNIVVERYW